MGRYEVSRGRDSQIRFTLFAVNGEIIATSVGFLSKDECLAALESSRKLCRCHVEDQTSSRCIGLRAPKFEIYIDKVGEFRFRQRDRKGNILCISEGYRSKRSCQNGIVSIAKNAPDAVVVSYI